MTQTQLTGVPHETFFGACRKKKTLFPMESLTLKGNESRALYLIVDRRLKKNTGHLW
jgi:hypothetical protein